jgi:hypothetical protein
MLGQMVGGWIDNCKMVGAMKDGRVMDNGWMDE